MLLLGYFTFKKKNCYYCFDINYDIFKENIDYEKC
jgi:hypothetical protein